MDKKRNVDSMIYFMSMIFSLFFFSDATTELMATAVVSVNLYKYKY